MCVTRASTVLTCYHVSFNSKYTCKRLIIYELELSSEDMVIRLTPDVRHRQQPPNLVTGVRQGLQKVHQTVLMRTNPDEIIVGIFRCPTSGDARQRGPNAT